MSTDWSAKETPLTALQASQERRASLTWTGGIIVFFVIQAIIWAIALYITNNDPSHAILPRYDQRALAWDKEAAALAHSQSLGWQVQLDVAAQADYKGQRVVTLQLKDKQGVGIEGATIEVSYFHQARAALRETIRFASSNNPPPASGTYTALLPLNRTGLWRFELEVEHQGEKFLHTTQAFVDAGK